MDFDTLHFSPTVDFHCEREEVVDYMICSTGRSGSRYLAHLMYSTGAMGYPMEYFGNRFFEHWKELAGSNDFPNVLAYIRSRRTSPNGYFGFKVHFHQFQNLARLIDFDTSFPNCRFILIERENLVAQAVSYVRALQSDQWHSMDRKKCEPWYDFEAIHDVLLRLLEERISCLP